MLTSYFVLSQVAEIRQVRQVLRQSVGVEGWNLGDAPGVAIVDSFRHEIGVQVLRRSARHRRVRLTVTLAYPNTQLPPN